jgi:hypothetical protein
MPTDVTIKIKGLCLCFIKKYPPFGENEPIWNIVFTSDNRHQLKFYFPEPDDPAGRPFSPKNLHIAGEDRFIDFLSTDPDPEPATADASARQHLLNMADQDFHGTETGGGRSKLKVHRKHPKGCDQIWMRVPRATLSASQGSKDQWLVEVNENGDPISTPVCKGPKAEEVTLRFQFVGSLQVRVGDERGNNSFDERFSGGDLTFEFNNKCDVGLGGINDFLDIYDSVIDETGRRFMVGKSIDCERVITDKIRERVIAEVRSVNANCDPVGSEPPPGP